MSCKVQAANSFASAAPETVSTLTCADPWLLARACYHLGNRHVPVQIMPGMIRYQHDHVPDDMLHGLGLQWWWNKRHSSRKRARMAAGIRIPMITLDLALLRLLHLVSPTFADWFVYLFAGDRMGGGMRLDCDSHRFPETGWQANCTAV